MKIKILNSEKFCKNIGYEESTKYNGFETEVLAIRDCLNQKKRRFLIILGQETNMEALEWCLEDESIILINESINDSWKKIETYSGGKNVEWFPFYFQEIRYTNVVAPIWMIESKVFFYDIIENKEEALFSFKKHS